METEQKHTDVPWALGDTIGVTMENEYITARKIVAQTPDAPTDIGLVEIDGPEAEANTEFICRACNCHDDLLAVCEGLIRCMDGDGNRWRHCRDLDAARAAIVKATHRKA